MWELFRWLFSAEFMPHGHCYFWRPELVWLEVVSNLAIGIAYVSISTTLAYLVWRIRDIPFQWVYVAFGVFIITCGGTHFFDVLTVWRPFYWLDGGLRALTAIASLATAVVMLPLVPRVISVVRAAQAGKELERLKTDFFANVSHELRTPLALILGPAERLLADARLDPAQRRDLEVMSRNARTLLKHVNDLLDVSKLEAGKMQLRWAAIDLMHLVRFVAGHFELIAEEKKIALSIDGPDAMPVDGDNERLQHVVLNLLSNAFKFTPAGGQVHVTLRIELGRALLTVADTGPGVRVEDRPFIFDRFRQAERGPARSFGGTGLGLAIVRDFVELHGGTVTVGEAEGGGARFSVSLPVAAPPGVTVERGAPASDVAEALMRQALDELRQRVEAAAGGGASEQPTVLVVEDNVDMNRFVSESLAPSYRVERAFDGVEGVAKAAAIVPDLIVSDVMMPRMSGDQLVAAIRDRPTLAAVPIVVLTAKADDELPSRRGFPRGARWNGSRNALFASTDAAQSGKGEDEMKIKSTKIKAGNAPREEAKK
jgi:signal transduction histidine kinase/CheY-like chemotaxis protein